VPDARVEETKNYLVDTEIKKVQYYLSHKEKYANYTEYFEKSVKKSCLKT